MQTRVKFVVRGRIGRDFASSHAVTALVLWPRGVILGFDTLNCDQFGLVRPTSRLSTFILFRLSTRNVLFYDSSKLQKIVEETNRPATQNPITQSSRMKAWSPVTKTELENFLGLSILMGHVQKGDLQSYWSTDLLLHTPIFGQIMSRDRYIHIPRFSL